MCSLRWLLFAVAEAVEVAAGAVPAGLGVAAADAAVAAAAARVGDAAAGARFHNDCRAGLFARNGDVIDRKAIGLAAVTAETTTVAPRR